MIQAASYLVGCSAVVILLLLIVEISFDFQVKRPVKQENQSSHKEDQRNLTVDDEEANYDEEFDENAREGKKRDFTKLKLKLDHSNSPLWACAEGRIFLETFSPLYKQAYDFLIAIAEPACRNHYLVHSAIIKYPSKFYLKHTIKIQIVVSRPESMHEYNLTPHSLYAAVSVGLETETIITVLNKLSKTKLPKEMIDFIYASTSNYGKVKLVLKKNRYFVESPFPEAMSKLVSLLISLLWQ